MLKYILLLILWCFLNASMFYNTYITYKYSPDYHYLYKLLGLGLLLSRSSASVLNFCCAFILVPMCRTVNSYIHYALHSVAKNALTFWLQHMNSIHMITAITIFIASVIHTLGHIMNAVNASENFDEMYGDLNWAVYKDQSPAILLLTSVSGISGFVMLVILVLMMLLSTRYVRDRDYYLFSVVHCLFVPFYILFLVHPLSAILKEQVNVTEHDFNCMLNTNCTTKPVFKPIPLQGWKWISPPLILYGFDLLYRAVTRSRSYFTVEYAKLYPGEVFKLTVSAANASVRFRPCQYILLRCREISSFEWHPFTVISHCRYKNQTQLSVLIRANGDWTCSLLRHLRPSLTYHYRRENFATYSKGVNCSRKHRHHLRIFIDGPFSSPLSDLLKSKVVICIAAGVGITPFASMISYLLSDVRCAKNKRPHRLHLIWIVKKCDYLCWFEDLLTDFHNENWIFNKPDRLVYQFYVTTENTIYSDVVTSPIILERIYIGRPDWDYLFSSWSTMYANKVIPVAVCGPPKFMDDVDKRCSAVNDSGCSFRCIRETFS